MTKFQTVQQSKKQIVKMQEFVDLVEAYQPETLEQQIIKEYAHSGSIVKVAEKVNSLGYSIEGRPYEGADISAVIRGKGNSDLHKVIRSGYLLKTRHSRTKKNDRYIWG